ncbi:tyrosine-type recombinase/integrase (plasmid) [Bradyrhizobium sp. PMVTL-01]|uniref:tyrosine-type recombinase/integrase n=1 Tax=Bradyrhizobium sp. PMVTL-01 TaxID=3434999 RepID=UPI003F6F5B51
MPHLQLKHIQAIIAPFTPVVQGNWMSALRGLMKFAVKTQLIASDPTAGVVKDKAEPSDGHVGWPEDDVAKFRKTHPLGTRQRLALELMLNLAVRRSDAIRIGPADIKGGWLMDFMSQKTSRTTGMKISVPLRAELKETAAMKMVSTKTSLVTEAGAPFATSGSFGAWMRKACDRAGLPEVSSHCLRKLGMIRLAMARVPPRSIMAISGHRSMAEVQRYVGRQHETGRASDCRARCTQSGNENVPKVSSGLGRRAKNSCHQRADHDHAVVPRTRNRRRPSYLSPMRTAYELCVPTPGKQVRSGPDCFTKTATGCW